MWRPSGLLALLSGLLVLGAAVATFPRSHPLGAEGRDLGLSGLRSDLAELPLYFIQNRGQVPDYVDYYLHGAETQVGFSSEGLVLSVPDDAHASLRWNLGVEFLGADRVEPIGRSMTPAVVSYFTGPRSQWDTGLPTYARVAYRDLWPGIDLVYRGAGSRLKYSFLVRPGADPSAIQLAYRGASDVEVNRRGQLEIATRAGRMVDDAPFSYQVLGGRRVQVPSAYEVAKDDSYGFRVAGYDPSQRLVIDPAMVVYAGYIGGSGEETLRGIAVDGTGAAYVTSSTSSTQATFPDGDGFGAVPGPDNTHNGGPNDAFVAKVSPSGTSLVYAGYIGGSDTDVGLDVAVDAAGAAYVAGFTASDQGTFPVTGGPDLTINGANDAFVAKVNPAGTSLAHAGYIGGAGSDVASGISVDAPGAAYVTGSTQSTQATFPDGDGFGTVPGPDQTHNSPGFLEAFVAKVAPSGASLNYAGYIGGSGFDSGSGIAVDGAGASYVAGDTASDQATFPETGGPDVTHNGGFDAFVAKIAPPGTSLPFVGYVGGPGEDLGVGIAVDGTGAAFLVGQTDSAQGSFPDGDGFGSLTGPDTTFNGVVDAFVAKVASAGTSLDYAGYIGGSDEDGGADIAVDGAGAAYMTGFTSSTQATFPDGDGFGAVPGPDTTQNGAVDGFVAKLAEPGPPSARCKGKSATQVGTPGNDALTGTKRADVIAALGGRDRVKALGGKDLVCAGDGNDTANGGGGKDRLFGEKGKDKVKGAGGNDRLNGGPKKDTCTGGAGTDKARKCEKEKSVP